MHVAIVTGGASGMGAATCRELAAQGCAVAVWDMQEAAGRAMVDELKATGVAATVAMVDVADQAAVVDALESTVAALGVPDVLVNCAGIRDLIPLFDITPHDWMRVLNVNLTGPFLCTQAVARMMVDNGGGAIVNVVSVAALASFPDRTAYVASKSGLLGLTRSTAQDLAKFNIRVNAVAPGVIQTPMSKAIQGRPESDSVVASTPLGRKGQPEEVAKAIAFLAGPASKYITGTMLTVDGGRMIVA